MFCLCWGPSRGVSSAGSSGSSRSGFYLYNKAAMPVGLQVDVLCLFVLLKAEITSLHHSVCQRKGSVMVPSLPASSEETEVFIGVLRTLKRPLGEEEKNMREQPRVQKQQRELGALGFQ
ncbi:hypothetical protein Ancab_024086 [Ancistrocladus abbreviatus]